jgi:hypothetical protein
LWLPDDDGNRWREAAGQARASTRSGGVGGEQLSRVGGGPATADHSTAAYPITS